MMGTMENRCDSVDALMYAYYVFMKTKEENQMLKKNKDYVEFILQYTSVDWARSKDCPEVCLKGYSDFSFPGIPIMDVVCNEFDHKVVVVSKRDFDQLQTENEELKKKLAVPDPFAEYKELFEKLRSKEDVEKFEWTLNHICGGQASVNGWMVTAKLWRRNYETLSKLVGFSSTEEIQDYLTNEAECDTLQEAILKLKDQVKYTCDEWYSANSTNNSWKAAAECNSPKELIEKREALEKEIGVYSRALNEWKTSTSCPSPSAAKTLIESGMSWHHAYNEIKKANEKLGEEVAAWKATTGYSIPEDYLHARLNSATPFDYTSAWQKATGCDAPLEANVLINNNKDAIRKWKDMTKCETPEAAATWITSYEKACERGNKLAEKVEEWKKATGCDTPGEVEEKIKHYKSRLGNAVQAASCTKKILDTITF